MTACKNSSLDSHFYELGRHLHHHKFNWPPKNELGFRGFKKVFFSVSAILQMLDEASASRHSDCYKEIVKQVSNVSESITNRTTE